VRPRILKAIHTRVAFSLWKIAVLSDADRSYVWRIVRELLKSGEIEAVCSRKRANGQSEHVYRVRHRDDFYLRHVRDVVKRVK